MKTRYCCSLWLASDRATLEMRKTGQKDRMSPFTSRKVKMALIKILKEVLTDNNSEVIEGVVEGNRAFPIDRNVRTELNDLKQSIVGFPTLATEETQRNNQIADLASEAEPEEVAEEQSDFEDAGIDALISVDSLFEELQALRNVIKEEFSDDSRWRGPSSNLLQRAVITAIVNGEPASLDDVLNYKDVAWRYSKYKTLMSDQIKRHGEKVDALIATTAWNKDYKN